MSEFDPRLAEIVDGALGSPLARVELLKSGLGAHRFARVICEDGRRAIARIETATPTGSGPEPPLEGIRAFLEQAGLPVPHRYGGGEGIELLEDLGDEALSNCARPEQELRPLYEEAVSLVARIQRLEAPTPSIPAFQRHLRDFLPLKRERTLEVSLPDWLGRAPRSAERACVRDAFDRVEEAVRDAPSRLAHRDFQSSNLMLRSGHLWMIDLQGAFLAPPEYDLVCLLRDSYVVLSAPVLRALAESGRSRLPDAPDSDVFQTRFDLLTIARKAKDDAFFVEAARRGDRRYLPFRAANRQYLGEAARRLAETMTCFEPWADGWRTRPERSRARRRNELDARRLSRRTPPTGRSPMRAMILAAGLGTRLQPLTELRAKPALPIRGVPMIAYALVWLKRNGVEEVAINLHHLPDSVRDAAERWCPKGLTLRFSLERELLDTGGGMKRVVEFLRESDPSIVIAGDMLFDLDLDKEVENHRSAQRRATLVLREDPRARLFGSIGVDEGASIRRIATRFDLGGETASGLYTSVNLFSPAAFDAMPESDRFSHLDHWLAPELRDGARDICGSLVTETDSVWEPVGTLEEYLAANLQPVSLRYWSGDDMARRAGAEFRPADALVMGAGVTLARDAELHHAIVWDGESVPAGFRGAHGIYAGGRFVGVNPP